MPTIDGRYVPDWHQAAIAAGASGDDDADNSETETEAPPPKRATRKRGGKKVETAMVDKAKSND